MHFKLLFLTLFGTGCSNEIDEGGKLCIYQADNDQDFSFDLFSDPICLGVKTFSCKAIENIEGRRYVLIAQSDTSCQIPPGRPSETLDCDDNNFSRFPGNSEICGNEIDEDCNGADLGCDCPDADMDGEADADCGGNDCDDSDPENFPGNDEACGDGQDNDCDEAFDCQDSDCLGEVCDAAGTTCTAQGTCECPTPSETDCGDGQSEDCDAQVDCADTDCAGQACGPNGQVCENQIAPVREGRWNRNARGGRMMIATP